MKTEITPITELQPGDKIYVEWPKNQTKPDWWKLPDVVTVKEVISHSGTVTIRETGGLSLNAGQLHKVIGEPEQKQSEEEQQLKIF